MQARKDLKDKVGYIFKTNFWGAQETQSGVGSSLDATRHVRSVASPLAAATNGAALRVEGGLLRNIS